MVMAILQTLVRGESYQLETSKKYKFYIKNFKPKFEETKKRYVELQSENQDVNQNTNND